MKEALLMALNVLKNRCEPDHPALIAVKAALANEALERKAENARELGLNYEPVAWGYCDRNGEITDCITPYEHARAEGDYRIPLYTTPPQRTWVGLTDEEIRACIQSNKYAFEIVRAAEAKMKEKNR